MAETLFNWKKTICICRGMPGSGKTTLALKLMKGDPDRVIENDDYWLTPKSLSIPLGYKQLYEEHANLNTCWYDTDPEYSLPSLSYEYERSLTHIAAYYCFAETFRRLRRYPSVTVANTFTQKQYIWPYVEEAKKLGIKVKIHTPKTKWERDVDALFEKNTHKVPKETIERMLSGWEDLTQKEIDDYLEIRK